MSQRRPAADILHVLNSASVSCIVYVTLLRDHSRWINSTICSLLHFCCIQFFLGMISLTFFWGVTLRFKRPQIIFFFFLGEVVIPLENVQYVSHSHMPRESILANQIARRKSLPGFCPLINTVDCHERLLCRPNEREHYPCTRLGLIKVSWIHVLYLLFCDISLHSNDYNCLLSQML